MTIRCSYKVSICDAVGLERYAVKRSEIRSRGKGELFFSGLPFLQLIKKRRVQYFKCQAPTASFHYCHRLSIRMTEWSWQRIKPYPLGKGVSNFQAIFYAFKENAKTAAISSATRADEMREICLHNKASPIIHSWEFTFE